MTIQPCRQHKDFHIAPMLDVSTPEFMEFFRILSKRAIIWTEMIVDETIMYSNDVDSHLAYSPHLAPIICQIGGRNAEYCGKATSIVESYKYNEVNLNIDCPSSRVSGKRKFGAILMKDAETANKVVSAMSNNAKNVPISVKTRVGIECEDGEILDTMEHLIGFIGDLRKRGCRKFYIHARKCVIGGLTPAQNRLVPPLNYPRAYALCHHFPDCEFILNGGIPGLYAAKLICNGTQTQSSKRVNGNEESEIITCVDEKHEVPCSICNASNGSCTMPPTVAPPNLSGVMLGRACMENPAMFWDIDRYFYGAPENPCQTRRDALGKYCEYLEKAYPRRCCDNDERITSKIPAPKVEMLNSNGCKICSSIYGNQDNSNAILMNEEQKSPSDAKVKISSRVVDLSLRPILGVFFGLRKSKQFRRECDKLSRDKTIRNCGPGFILRQALLAMPSEMLDQAFTKTEDLSDESVPLHVGPIMDGCKGCVGN